MCRAGLLAGLLHLGHAPTAWAAAPRAPIAFGVDMASVKNVARQHAQVSYGAFWVGAWTQKFGWNYAEQQLKAARREGVTPVVNWWYWGDDISPSSVEHGCMDKRQNVRKDRETWYRMSSQLADLIDRTMGDRDAIVVLETEFNKNGIEQYTPFDGYLADQIKIFHRKPHIHVVLGFGNWGREHWGRFEHAVAEADFLGTQLLQSSVRDAASYTHAVDTLLAGARFIKTKFGKPSLIVDLALSSYPAQQYERYQAEVMRELFERLPELKEAGVRGVIWRQLADDPKFDTSNYHGVAERYWGLIRANGSAKPAFDYFLTGIRTASRSR